jgi:hypothetical protein
VPVEKIVQRIIEVPVYKGRFLFFSCLSRPHRCLSRLIYDAFGVARLRYASNNCLRYASLASDV